MSVVIASLSKAFPNTVEMSRAQHETKAIYFEYFYDGGDASTGDLFLCSEYSRENDEWASHFKKSNVINGPNVQSLLGFDPEIELDQPESVIAFAYAHARLLSALVRVRAALRFDALPVGFAQHDGSIVHLGGLS